MRGLIAGGAAALILSAAAAASTAGLAQLRDACVADGTGEETCACLSDFVAERFSEREIDGAVLVIADPVLSNDPGAALSALSQSGYSLSEIMAVINRVVELEDVARTTCATAPAKDAPEAAGADATQDAPTP